MSIPTMESATSGNENPCIFNCTEETAAVQFPQFLQIVSFAIGIPVILFGCTGNFLTLFILLKTPVLRTPANVFLMSLAVSDILHCVVIIPIQLSVYVSQSWPFGDAFCRVYPFLNLTFVGATMWCLAATALGRHFKIIYSSLYARFFNKQKKAAVLVGICWMIPIISQLPTLFRVWGEFGYEDENLSCALKRLDDANISSFGTFFIVTSLVLPMGLILFSYLRIYCTVMTNHRRVHHAIQEQRAMFQEKGNKTIKQPNQNQAHREDIRFTKIMMCIFMVCIVCYFPYLIVNLSNPIISNVIVNNLASMCVWISASLNPVVYVLLNRPFRKAFIKLVQSQRKQPFTPNM